ncbi:MAG TPA: hypothetical protein PL063_05370 [Candidatus Cloacimonadota bacterium]|jgi:hypothetical protein|nr:hypothetical protein [Candidatus Cloacimonadales bacterium]HPY96621.1 hypothetical protein [Candidatus Cloacimonadota bacterium]HQB40952.1 hypothetical protein [Candidatus Cloacimonadota bacterium]
MIGSLISKAYLSLVSFSVLLFSNYVGNTVSFSPLSSQIVGDNIVFSAHLINAFENDFDEIFKSGKDIKVWFELRIIQNNKIIHSESFNHQVTWDSKNRVYLVDLQEQNYKTRTRSSKELKRLLSVVEYPFYKASHRGNATVQITAHLPKIYMEEIDKELDLMVLWKLQKPVIKKEVHI